MSSLTRSTRQPVSSLHHILCKILFLAFSAIDRLYNGGLMTSIMYWLIAGWLSSALLVAVLLSLLTCCSWYVWVLKLATSNVVHWIMCLPIAWDLQFHGTLNHWLVVRSSWFPFPLLISSSSGSVLWSLTVSEWFYNAQWTQPQPQPIAMIASILRRVTLCSNTPTCYEIAETCPRVIGIIYS